MVVKQLGFFIDDNVKCRPFRTQKFIALFMELSEENICRYGVKVPTIKLARFYKINVSPTLANKVNDLFFPFSLKFHQSTLTCLRQCFPLNVPNSGN